MAPKPKPIFCVTHPRACSTAFERVSSGSSIRVYRADWVKVFMTRHDLACVHEPFGDAFYYGWVYLLPMTWATPDCHSPERMSIRYEDDENARKESGFEQSTYATIFDRLDREESDVSNWLLLLLTKCSLYTGQKTLHQRYHSLFASTWCKAPTNRSISTLKKKRYWYRV